MQVIHTKQELAEQIGQGARVERLAHDVATACLSDDLVHDIRGYLTLDDHDHVVVDDGDRVPIDLSALPVVVVGW